MVKVLINGCNGKMGKVLAGEIEQTQDIETICGVDRQDTGDNKFPVYTDISQIIEEVIKKKYNIIKIIYKNKETDAFKKFKLEASAMLKECGVNVVYSS